MACLEGYCDVGDAGGCVSLAAYVQACMLAGVQAISSSIDECGVCRGSGSTCAAQTKTCTVFSESFSFDGALLDFGSACEYVAA